MSRERAEAAFVVVLAALLAWVIWGALDWDLRARLFPMTVGIPVLALVVIYAALTFGRHKALPAPVVVDEFDDTPEDVLTRDTVRRGLVMAGWTVAFGLGVWLLGFRIGSGLMALIYLRAVGREKWAMCVVYALCMYAVLALGFDGLLGIDFPPGVLQRLVGLEMRFF